MSEKTERQTERPPATEREDSDTQTPRKTQNTARDRDIRQTDRQGAGSIVFCEISGAHVWACDPV